MTIKAENRWLAQLDAGELVPARTPFAVWPLNGGVLQKREDEFYFNDKKLHNLVAAGIIGFSRLIVKVSGS